MKWITKGVLAASVVGTVAGGAALLRDRTTAPSFSTDAQLDGRTVVVTGANTGIGRETALECARRGARVTMACRDITKCEEARKFIVLETRNKYVYCKHLDLASQESIRKFARRLNESEEHLDVLVNNAGVMRCPRGVTAEGIELQLGVNHMGHFLLTNLLVDKLKSSAPSRVVNLVSVAHKHGCLNFRDLNRAIDYSAAAAYNDSQLANMLFTMELARKLKGTGVTCNAVHPGLCKTDLGRHMSFYNSWLAAVVVKPMQWFVLRSPAQGAAAVVYAAAEPSLVDVTGEYISDVHGVSIGEVALDERLAARMWTTSTRWTRLDDVKSTSPDVTPAPGDATPVSPDVTSASSDATPASPDGEVAPTVAGEVESSPGSMPEPESDMLAANATVAGEKSRGVGNGGDRTIVVTQPGSTPQQSSR